MEDRAWRIHSTDQPVITPGRLHGESDAGRASAPCVIRVGDRYRMYYWASGEQENVICAAESPVDSPNAWSPLGVMLGPQPGSTHNTSGPRFPCVLPREGKPWLMYVLTRGCASSDNPWPSRMGLAISDDQGLTWRYANDRPLIEKDKPYERMATGSLCVFPLRQRYLMYYTAYRDDIPAAIVPGVTLPAKIERMGLALAVSDDGVNWTKTGEDWHIPPRGFGTVPFEHKVAKPCVVRMPDGTWRMWVSCIEPDYRVCSLVSADGVQWEWLPTNYFGELGRGESGRFDDQMRTYAWVVREGDELRCWYAGNQHGATGIGYATRPAAPGAVNASSRT